MSTQNKAEPEVTGALPAPSGPTPGRRRVFALLAFLLPLLGVLLLEAGLRLFGFGDSYPLFIPIPEADGFLRVNPFVVRRFMADESKTPKLWIRPVYFERRKSPETLRIFVQGGSTAEGYPYGYPASPAGMLQQRLQRTLPKRKVEVITTAMAAVNTYTLLDFSDEIVEQQPDAVVIYAGHNEYVGILGVASGYSVGRQRFVVRSFLALRDMRVFQLAQRVLLTSRAEEGSHREERGLMATIVAEKNIAYGSILYRRGLEQYRANLRALLMKYRRAGIPVFIGTLVSNERDQPPFLSSHGEGVDAAAWEDRMAAGKEALEAGDAAAARRAFAAAVAIDELHAEGYFKLAQALDELGRHGEAQKAYLDAKDRDQLRFRAPEKINDILREVATEQGAHVVDVQAAFHREARFGIVGYDLMLEHLHPNLDGYFVMADAFYEALGEKGFFGEGSIPRDVAREEMPVTEVDRLFGEYRIERLTSDWPFSETQQQFRIAPAQSPIEEIAQDYFKARHNWPDTMRSLLHHYRRTGDVATAAKVSVLLAERFPNDLKDQEVAAQLLQRARRPEAALYLRRVERAKAKHTGTRR